MVGARDIEGEGTQVEQPQVQQQEGHKVAAGQEVVSGGNTVYYWRTTFELEDAEREFLTENNVERLYLRYFDVGLGDRWLGEEMEPVPVATVRFNSDVPDNVEVVPVVYITLDAIEWKGSPSEIALLMSTLADKGYIDYPMRKNGARNSAEFHRNICQHFSLHNGSVVSILNSLKDNRITPDNLFQLAMDKIPHKDKVL